METNLFRSPWTGISKKSFQILIKSQICLDVEEIVYVQGAQMSPLIWFGSIVIIFKQMHSWKVLDYLVCSN